MKVKTVIKKHIANEDYSAELFGARTTDEEIAKYYAERHGFAVDDFDEKYEIRDTTVYGLK